MYTKEEVRKTTLKYFDNDDLATNVWVTKYALKDSNGNFLEKTPSEMHARLSKEFARIEEKFGGERSLSEKKINNLLKDFKYIVPQGSPMYGIGNNHVNISLSNCVVVEPPKDNISSIIDSGKNLANLMKRRCGVGIDVSELRPEHAPVNNSAGTTTGAWSFADFYSYVCRMIGQNGRRGALMITMDVRHPDIERFITMKHDLTKVTGANVSVKISDDFMQAVETDEEFTLSFPIGSSNPTFKRAIRAKKIWNMIVESATKTAEPGILMWDNIVKNLPAHEYKEFKTVCTNPCSELPLSAYDSCRLISINLKNFVKNPFKKEASFDFKKFKNVVSAGMRLSDDLVELEIEKLQKILNVCDTEDEKVLWGRLLKACKNGRRTGLGTHGLAEAIACMGFAYDSDEALVIVDMIYDTLKVSAYTESVELAKERGAFPVFDWETEQNNAYIQKLPKILRDKISRFGRRNISLLTNAPTGSVSILSKTSSGIEPVFRNTYKRRRKLNHDEQSVKADFVDGMGDRWAEHDVFHHNVQEYLKLMSTKKVPSFFVESNSIDWQKRVKFQALIQQHIDHAISSTINLPKGTAPSVVGELYTEGWRLGLKGITVYVDGSRSGVLIDKKDERTEFKYQNAFQRPDELDCEIHRPTIKGERWTIMVGLMEGKPYEVIGGLSNLVEIPKKYDTGKIIKRHYKTKESEYDLYFGDGGVLKNVVKIFDNPNHAVHTRMLSLGLRHGAKPSFLVEQLLKDPDSDFQGFSKVLARTLKKYIQDGTKCSGDKHCPSCENEQLVYQDGCVFCSGCGWTKCS